MLTIPGMTVTAPRDGAEMLALLRLGLSVDSGPFSIRWPRANVPTEVPPLAEIPEVPFGKWEVVQPGKEVLLLAVGAMVEPARAAADLLAAEGRSATVVNCRFLKPYDRSLLGELLPKHSIVVTIEEGSVSNGFGAYMAREIADDPGLTFPEHFATMGIPDRFIEHGAREDLLREIGLDPAGIAARVRGLLGQGIRVSRESA